MSAPPPRPFRRVPSRVVAGARNVGLRGSDVRISDPQGPCALCGQVGQLRLGHITPKWVYRWMKLEGSVIGNYRSLSTKVESQDGDKHYLLCDSCEHRLGAAESYVKDLVTGLPVSLEARDVQLAEGPLLIGVDHVLVRRAVLGILLKAHHAPSQAFASVVLPEPMLERLKSRLITDTYDHLSHPLIATKWLNCTIPSVNPRAIMFAGYGTNRGLTAFDLTMAGWSFSVFFRGWKQVERMPGFSHHANLGRGSWLIYLADLSIHRGVNRGSAPYTSEVDPWRRFSRQRRCPCGLSARSFEHCCALTWCSLPIAGTLVPDAGV